MVTRNKAVSIELLVGVLLAIIPGFAHAEPNTIYVPDNYSTIHQDLETPGTVYIRADGAVDPPTAPILNVGNVYYTFTADIYDSIVVQRSNIIIDGAGYMLQGSGSKQYGFVFSGKNNITIKNTRIEEFNYGVYIHNSHNAILTSNSITRNHRYGVYICEGSSNNRISGNIVANNYNGIAILYSPNNILRNNNMVSNQYSFGVYSYDISEYVQDVDASNFVDGKPVYYWLNRQNMEVPSDAGYVALVNCYNITAKGLEVKNNGQGILLANTTNSQIKDNDVKNNNYGVWVYYSSNNTLSGNAITNNFRYGFRLWSSFNNVLTENTVANTSATGAGYGIWLGYSSDNKIFQNNFINNVRQVALYESLNVWDDGYPSGGNYWSDYTGVDLYSGPNQDQSGSDSIGDTPYVFTSGQDNYPLMMAFENYFPPVPADGKGMWINTIWELGESVPQIIDRLRAAGLKWVAIKCGDSDSFWLRPDGAMTIWLIENGYSSFDQVIDEFHDAGINVYGWQYVYSYDRWVLPDVNEADVANMILDIPGIDGLIIDAECEYEEDPGPSCPLWQPTGDSKAEIAISYMQAIRARHPKKFIAYTTFPIIDFHTGFPYLEFGRHCDAVMPQAYWKELGVTPEYMIYWMEEQWNMWQEVWRQQGYGDSVKRIIPIGQGWDLPTSEESEEIIRFCTLTYDHRYSGVSLWEYTGMTPDNWQDYKASFCSPLTIASKSPVDIVVTDPDGLSVSKQASEVPSAVYVELDMMGGGDPEDKVIIPRRKIGDYHVNVVPEPNALPTDTYGLEATTGGVTMVLAEDVRIGDIPNEPYQFESKLNRADFDADGDVDIADLNSLSQQWLAADCNYPNWCEGTDLDYNGGVDFLDYTIFAQNWLWETVRGDFDIDGDVDFKDYVIMALAWLTRDGDSQYNPRCDISVPPDNYVDWRDLDALGQNWLLGK